MALTLRLGDYGVADCCWLLLVDFMLLLLLLMRSLTVVLLPLMLPTRYFSARVGRPTQMSER